MRYDRTPIFAALTVAAAGVVWAPAVMAQTPPQQQRPPAAQQQQQRPPAAQPQQPAKNYDQQELKSYASARVEVQRLNQEYQPQIRAAGSPQKQQQLHQQALQQMAAAVRDQGLSVKKYNEISRAVQTNPQLASRVQSYIDEAN